MTWSYLILMAIPAIHGINALRGLLTTGGQIPIVSIEKHYCSVVISTWPDTSSENQ